MSKRQQTLFDAQQDPAPWILDDRADRLIASVVLPQAPFGPFDYLVPDCLRDRLAEGCRVRVPLGRGNRTVPAYCVRLMSPAGIARSGFSLKEISSVVDSQPLISASMLRLTRWMSRYYLCAWGQVLEAVVPAGVRSLAGTREVTFLSLAAEVAARGAPDRLSAKQAAVLRCLGDAGKALTVAQLCEAAGCTSAPIRALRRKGLIRTERRRLHQQEYASAAPAVQAPPPLNTAQRMALAAILESLRGRRHDTVLVHGVTGSGKTELYMRAIEEVLSYRRQAIVLVPEISLTPQTMARFRARFDQVAILHSHLSPAERHWHWRKIAAGEAQVVVGARSAVFAPAPHLGLIVLDEEHDASFKQESVPRYHAREVAIRRARLEQIPVVAGSATPALESWRAAQRGRYHLVELPERVLSRPLPDVRIVDLRVEHRNRFYRGAISRPLQQAITEALREGGQVMLLLNRRGYSTSIQCPGCGEVVRCPDCDIALTHHREGEKAVCHYCDYQRPPPAHCPHCRFAGIRYSGLGTQRLEAEIRGRFPEAGCLRMDSDSMRRPGSHQEALERFQAGEARILLGTQMIAKGLDFPEVTLVGVVNADTALHFPDFRAAERTFQLVSQVAGRAGRGPRGGRVLVQTFSPDHPAILAAMRHDYRTFATREWQDREQHGYPPAVRMARIIVRGASSASVEAVTSEMRRRLERAAHAGDRTRFLGPAPAPLARLRGKHRYHILVTALKPRTLRMLIQEATGDLSLPDGVQWVVDVDPLDML